MLDHCFMFAGSKLILCIHQSELIVKCWILAHDARVAVRNIPRFFYIWRDFCHHSICWLSMPSFIDMLILLSIWYWSSHWIGYSVFFLACMNIMQLCSWRLWFIMKFSACFWEEYFFPVLCCLKLRATNALWWEFAVIGDDLGLW